MGDIAKGLEIHLLPLEPTGLDRLWRDSRRLGALRQALSVYRRYVPSNMLFCSAKVRGQVGKLSGADRKGMRKIFMSLETFCLPCLNLPLWRYGWCVTEPSIGRHENG